MSTTLFKETKTIVLKTNNSCDLKCTYCYDESNNSKPFRTLDLDNVYSTLKQLVDYSKKNRISNLNLIWHGGEPLLMGIDYYSKIVNMQKDFNFDFSNLIQTNATHLNLEWVDFFRKNNFKIGVSFDGSVTANNIHRQKTDIVIKNIELLNQYSIYPSLICVISDLNFLHYNEMFDFLKTIKTEYTDLIPCYENNGRYSLSNSNYKIFMKSMFDLWWNSDRKLNIRFFHNIVDKMQCKVAFSDFITCSLTGRCGEIISINSDQKVYFCDCLPKETRYQIGLLSQGFDNIGENSNYNALKLSNDFTHKDCLECNFLNICGKGCLTRRQSKNYDLNKDYYCEGRQFLFKHIQTILGITEIKNKVIGTPAFTRGPQPIQNKLSIN